MNEFVDLVVVTGCVDDSFGSRDIGTLYNLSVMTQVDEIHSDRHLQMRFVEFVEAICRVADKVITPDNYLQDEATMQKASVPKASSSEGTQRS